MQFSKITTAVVALALITSALVGFAAIGFSIIAAVIGATQSEWFLSVTAVAMAGLFTYGAARADHRWRDSRRADP